MIPFTTRIATEEDMHSILALDAPASESERRRAFFERNIRDRCCHLLSDESGIIGYGVLEYTFFGRGFVSLLFVRSQSRRCGIGTAFMECFEGICRSDRLFTTTNLSNLPMQALLTKRGYTLCGVINDLDEGDPELVYNKVVVSPES